MQEEIHNHLFLITGKNAINLWKDEYPVELKISSSKLYYNLADPHNLEFELAIRMYEKSQKYQRFLSFTVSATGDMYTFTYLDNLYHKKWGKLEGKYKKWGDCKK